MRWKHTVILWMTLSVASSQTLLSSSRAPGSTQPPINTVPVLAIARPVNTIPRRDVVDVEGSGMVPPTIASPTIFSMSEDVYPLTTLSSGGSTSASTLLKFISKRAVPYFNGVVGPNFYSTFDIRNPKFPPNAVSGMDRPLRRGSSFPRSEYVALWLAPGGMPHWGTVHINDQGVVEGSFIQNGQIYNLTQMSPANVRLLTYVGTPESNNFKFQWTSAREYDPTTALARKATNSCGEGTAPAVYRDGDYEFLGEADIDARTMFYIAKGSVHIVDSAHYTSSVFVLTKQRCSCSC